MGMAGKATKSFLAMNLKVSDTSVLRTFMAY